MRAIGLGLVAVLAVGCADDAHVADVAPAELAGEAAHVVAPAPELPRSTPPAQVVIPQALQGNWCADEVGFEFGNLGRADRWAYNSLLIGAAEESEGRVDIAWRSVRVDGREFAVTGGESYAWTVPARDCLRLVAEDDSVTLLDRCPEAGTVRVHACAGVAP